MQGEDHTICDDLWGFENTTYRNEIGMIEIYTCTEEDYFFFNWRSRYSHWWSMNEWSVDALVNKNVIDIGGIWGYSRTIVN